MKLRTMTGLALVAAMVAAGCAREEEEVVVMTETPIYAKDGTIVGMRPTVGHSGDMMADTALDDDDSPSARAARINAVTGTDDDDSDG